MANEIVCEKCGAAVNKFDYTQHLKIHKERKVETCKICSKTFTNTSNYKYHMSHHSEERPWICDECPKSYKTKIDLIQHKRVHDRIREPYSCEICHQKFSIKSKYNTHLRVHSVKGPQRCTLCDKNFVNLRSHIQQVHQKIKKYKCLLCQKEFGKRSGLVRHTMTVHEKLKTWQCDICNKSFGEKSQLMKHRDRHLKRKMPIKKILKETNNDRLNNTDIADNTKSQEDQEKQRAENSEVIEIYVINLEEENSSKIQFKESSVDNSETSSKHNDFEFGSKTTNLEQIEEIDDNIEVLDEFRDSVYVDILGKYKCHLCSITFKQKRYYQSHLQVIHNGNREKLLLCNYCPEKFTHRTQRLRHMRRVHPEIYEENVPDKIKNDKGLSERKCNICDKVFKKSKYLEIHCSSVHNTQFFQCDICLRKFSFKRSMERHIRAVHENIRDFNCTEPSCNKAFRSQYELNEHFKNIHIGIKNNNPMEHVTCDICQKVCSSRKHLYSHNKMVHEGVRWGNNYECKICLEKFDTKYQKIKHSFQVHRNGEEMLRTCHLCSSQFQLYDDFKAHIESHNDFFICMICGYHFIDESSLFIHLESHKKIEEDLRPFICDICSHRLSTKAQLEIHMRKHFCENYYVCDECGQSYKFLAPFLHHKLVHENKFDYKCSFCSKEFRKKRDQILHEKTHGAERPYKCNICEKTFVLKPNYVNHMKTHQPKIFECKMCHVYQSSSSKLRLHELSEHPEEFPFKCISCSKTFKTSYTFEQHKGKCTRETNFEC